jgi:hypothetical protein
MTGIANEMRTAVGLRVTFPRIGADRPEPADEPGSDPTLGPSDTYDSREKILKRFIGDETSPPGTVALSLLHDVLGLLDEFCSVVNLVSMLEEGADTETASRLRAIYFQQISDPDHSDTLVQVDSSTRSLVAPVVRRVYMNSPLTIELIGSLSTGALYLLKHPDLIGGWIPSVKEHWFQARIEADRAKRAYDALTEVGIKVEDLDE